MPLLSVARARELDARAASLGIPTLLLMENAARGIALAVQAERPTGRVVVLCGPGNNGGDGLAAARHLLAMGRRVRIVMLAQKCATPDGRTNLAFAQAVGVPIVRLTDRPHVLDEALRGTPGVLVECLFGSGLSRPLSGPAADAVAMLAAARTRGWVIVSADTPAGLDADTGVPNGPCVVADVTVTFAGMKGGLRAPKARRYAGKVIVVDIGVPLSILAASPARR
jgi:NAD(P)H-hydrate epimerase